MAFFSPEFVFRLFFFPASVRASSWSKEPPSSSSRAATHKDQRPRPTTNMQVGANTQTHRRSFVSWSFCPYSLHKRAPGKQKNCIAEAAFPILGLSVFIPNCVKNHDPAGSDLSRPAAEHEGCSQIISTMKKSHKSFNYFDNKNGLLLHIPGYTSTL